MKTMTQYIQEEMKTNATKPTFYSGLITFTIKEGKDSLRTSFLKKFEDPKDDFKMLDQSTYGIKDASKVFGNDMVKEIREKCKEAEIESGQMFDGKDSVTFYRAGLEESYEKEKWDKIAAYKVI